MNTNEIKYAVDIGLLITFILVFTMGVIKFPEFTRYFTGVYTLVLPRTINKIHDWSGLIMGILVIVHLILNYKWLVVMTKNIFKRNK